MNDPFNLTPREAEAMTAMLEHGCSKLASRSMRISPRTIDVMVGNAMAKMGCRNRVRALILWDRWLQTQMVLPDLPLGHLERINMGLALKLRRARHRSAA